LSNYGDESKGYKIPVGAHLSVESGEKVKAGQDFLGENSDQLVKP